MFVRRSATVSASFALAALLFASAGMPHAARAQRVDLRAPPAKGFGAIAGIVDDSIRRRPLAGAVVAIIGSSQRTTVDPEGFFRIDSVPPGEVQLAVLHPLLDSLSIVLTSQKIPIAAGRLEEISISTPLLARVRERLCPAGGRITPGTAMLAGRVDGADDDKPMGNAVVSLVYTEPSLGTAAQRVRTARTRDDGQYVICGLPETLIGTVQASVGTVTSSEIPVALKAEYLVTASFLIGSAPSKDSTVRGTAVLSGRITDVTGAPIAQAQVAVEGGNAIAVTSTDGSFMLRGLPSGTTSAVVRKIGYSPAFRTVHLRANEPQKLTAVLAEGARTLAAVTVVGKMDAALKSVGFNERRNMGSRSGFMLPDDIEKRKASQFTDLARMLPGFRVNSMGTGAMIEGTRSAGGGGTSGCVNVFVDRVAFEQMSPGDLDSAFPIHTIGALESYASAVDTPQEFRMAGRSCATIVAWTKMKLSKP